MRNQDVIQLVGGTFRQACKQAQTQRHRTRADQRSQHHQ